MAQVTNVDFSLHHFILPLMRAARARGHEVVGVCAEGPLLATARAEGFRVEAMPLARSLRPGANWRGLQALRAMFRRERFDLVHAHMPISGVLARVAARSVGVPRVAYTAHGFLFNQPGPWWRRQLALRLEQAAGRLTDTLLTVSEAEAADARRLGIHRRPVAVGNGRDPGRFRPDGAARAAMRASLGVPDHACVVIAVARLVRHKGWPELLEAASRVPGLVLWAVGERLPSDHGEDLAPYFSRAEETMAHRLHRLGSRDDVPALLAAADMFCLPSHFEGLPMSIIEAMLTGLPVVATDISGPREQVVHGTTGLLVPRGEPAMLAAALGGLAADPGLRARLGAAGRTRALARYDEAVVNARTLDALGL